ncbi:MAG: hypothetical protein ACE5LH_01110 [Fidelibacterota bacterium]
MTAGILAVVFLSAAVAGGPKFSDEQIVGMTPHYFKRFPDSPEFLGARVYRHPQRGKVFQVDIRVDRNRETEGLGFAFSAMLNLSRYFRRPPDLFVALLHSPGRGIPPVICTGDARCTADHYIHGRISYEEWYHRCITFERP